MTVQTVVQCSYCQAEVPLSSTYEPFPGNGAIRRCRDAVACQNRQLYAGTGVPAEPAGHEAQPLSAPSPCQVCGAADPPGGLYERLPFTWFCRDRAGCEQRAVNTQYLTSHGDESGDVAMTPAQMRRMISEAGPAPASIEYAPEPETTTVAAVAAVPDPAGTVQVQPRRTCKA